MVVVLAYIVILMAIVYLILQYSGVFKDIAAMFDRLGKGRAGSPRQTGSADDKEDLAQRLQVFEDFLGQSDQDDAEGE